MKRRIITATILGLILIPVVIVPALTNLFEIFVLLLMGVACVEVLNLFDKEKKVKLPIKIMCLILTFGLYASIINSLPNCADTITAKFFTKINVKVDIFTAISIILVLVLGSMVVVDGFDASDAGKCFVEIFYIGITFACFTSLRHYGVRFIIYLLLVTMFTDIFALVFGLTLGKGKKKMAPKISPKKTWVGAIGGTCVAVAVGVTFLFIYESISPVFHDGEHVEFFTGVFNYEKFNGFQYFIFAFLLTLAMSVCSQIGDLVASKLKRTYGIKDYSNIFPGHGGVLDRFDSALFTSAIFLAFIQLSTIMFPLLESLPILGAF